MSRTLRTRNAGITNKSKGTDQLSSKHKIVNMKIQTRLLNAIFLTLLISTQGCATKRTLINPYQEPDPATTRTARIRLESTGIGHFAATVYKNPERASCMNAKEGAEIGVFAMIFGTESSSQIIGMPSEDAWSKKIGSEYYFKADEPIVIGATWGGSNISYTGFGFSNSSHSCNFAAGIAPEEGKDYELKFTDVKGPNGKAMCGAILRELQPDPKNEGKFIGTALPLQRVMLYSSDVDTTSICKGTKP
jgi:hypothetical protein